MKKKLPILDIENVKNKSYLSQYCIHLILSTQL